MDTLLAHGVTSGGSNAEIAICHDTRHRENLHVQFNERRTVFNTAFI